MSFDRASQCRHTFLREATESARLLNVHLLHCSETKLQPHAVSGTLLCQNKTIWYLQGLVPVTILVTLRLLHMVLRLHQLTAAVCHHPHTHSAPELVAIITGRETMHETVIVIAISLSAQATMRLPAIRPMTSFFHRHHLPISAHLSRTMDHNLAQFLVLNAIGTRETQTVAVEAVVVTTSHPRMSGHYYEIGVKQHPNRCQA